MPAHHKEEPRRELQSIVLAAIDEHGMVDRGNRVLVAVSGGPDSVALLRVLLDLAPERGFDLAVFHLNHHLRGTHSDRDQAFVEELAATHGLTVVVRHGDPAAVRSGERSPEEAARDIRYEALDLAADEIAADRIATGHTVDDQVETFLMRVLRGSGLEGLRGIPPVRGHIIRPLLSASRSQVLAYLQAISQEFVVDHSNLEPVHLRNRLRLDILPRLDELAPGWRRKVLEAIAIVRAEDEEMRSRAEAVFAELSHEDDGQIILEVGALARQPLAVQRRVVLLAAARASGGLVRLGLSHVDAILGRLDQESGWPVHLPGELRVWRERDSVFLRRGEGDAAPVERTLQVPGKTAVPELGMQVSAAVVGAQEAEIPAEKHRACLDWTALAKPLTLRAWRPGDRFRPLGLAGSKKIHDYLVDRKVPRRLRSRILVLESGGRIVWVVGEAVSEEAKMRPVTREVLKLSYETLESLGHQNG